MARILLIDDEPMVVTTLEAILVSAGHDVRSANDGRAGIILFDRWKPDVVVTDIIMPDQEGLQTIREIRDRQPATGIVAISGGARLVNVDYLEAALRLGATKVLRKPFGSRELLAAIDYCLSADSDQDCRQL